MEDLRCQGVAPFAGASGYIVFRNVKQWRARGEGGKACGASRIGPADGCQVADDTAAMNAAISDGDCCGGPGLCWFNHNAGHCLFPSGSMINSPILSQ